MSCGKREAKLAMVIVLLAAVGVEYNIPITVRHDLTMPDMLALFRSSLKHFYERFIRMIDRMPFIGDIMVSNAVQIEEDQLNLPLLSIPKERNIPSICGRCLVDNSA
jgi:hypothetical protein